MTCWASPALRPTSSSKCCRFRCCARANSRQARFCCSVARAVASTSNMQRSTIAMATAPWSRADSPHRRSLQPSPAPSPALSHAVGARQLSSRRLSALREVSSGLYPARPAETYTIPGAGLAIDALSAAAEAADETAAEAAACGSWVWVSSPVAASSVASLKYSASRMITPPSPFEAKLSPSSSPPPDGRAAVVTPTAAAAPCASAPESPVLAATQARSCSSCGERPGGVGSSPPKAAGTFSAPMYSHRTPL